MSKGKTLNKKLVYLIVIVIVAIVSAFGSNFDKITETPQDSQNTVNHYSDFKVHYIDVGQGDCALVECDGKTLLIDAGENGYEQTVINYLYSRGVEKLDYIVASHQHSDHIGGLPEVIEEFGMDNIIMPELTQKQTPTNSTYKAFLKAVKNSGASGIYSKVGSVYNLGSATFEILGPVSNNAEDINNMSIILKVTYGENTFLFTGDAESDEEKEVVSTGADLDSDVLKVGHHGSYTSSCKEFLEAVTPEICVIMCGENNDYGHPHDAATDRISNYTDEVYRTDICGNIVISSDGTNLDVAYENQ